MDKDNSVYITIKKNKVGLKTIVQCEIRQTHQVKYGMVCFEERNTKYKLVKKKIGNRHTSQKGMGIRRRGRRLGWLAGVKNDEKYIRDK